MTATTRNLEDIIDIYDREMSEEDTFEIDEDAEQELNFNHEV